MRTYTTEHTVYTCDELTKEAQTRAIDDYRQSEWETGLYGLEEDMTEELHRLLKQHKITPVNVTVRYSLSNCQGDGASFTGDIEYKAWRATVGANHWGHHYMHWNSVDVSEMTSMKTDKEAPDETLRELDQIVHDIGRELEKYGYDCIEDALSDETIIDTINANEYEFTIDGAIS